MSIQDEIEAELRRSESEALQRTTQPSNDWQDVHRDTDGASGWHDVTQRISVPGGWLYRTIVFATLDERRVLRLALQFVPAGN